MISRALWMMCRRMISSLVRPAILSSSAQRWREAQFCGLLGSSSLHDGFLPVYPHTCASHPTCSGLHLCSSSARFAGEESGEEEGEERLEQQMGEAGPEGEDVDERMWDEEDKKEEQPQKQVQAGLKETQHMQCARLGCMKCFWTAPLTCGVCCRSSSCDGAPEGHSVKSI